MVRELARLKPFMLTTTVSISKIFGAKIYAEFVPNSSSALYKSLGGFEHTVSIMGVSGERNCSRFCRVWAYASDDVISPLRLGGLGSGLARGPPIARLHRLMRMPDQGPHHGALHGHFDSTIQTSYAETNDSASIPFPSSLAQWI
uniref:Uncharacterized protein n=1 Tax=Coccidioides posadasii RMSCC 3488 TaxID=454284 RepID=A0A0J6F3T1_COCPO|nr:hypothetical protein CPAG_00297 [Coccidioides posadasii RMSCC 3488]